MTSPTPTIPQVTWVACHDTLVCSGAKQNQKWCVREGNKKGPLIAVMLTKEIAHLLVAAPDMLAALKQVAFYALINHGSKSTDYGEVVGPAISKAQGHQP